MVLMGEDELRSWLRLSLTRGVGNSSGRKLLAALGLPQAIFQADLATLQHIVQPNQAQALLATPPELERCLAQTLTWLHGEDSAGAGGPNSPSKPVVPRRIVTLGDAAYPAALMHMEDPPLLLYAMGHADLTTLTMASCIAIVGSRSPTPQGALNAREMASTLVSAGLTVVSGLALGVDGAAHEGALAGTSSNANGAGQAKTVAVVGTGLDRVYPKSHHDLAHRIAREGLLLSEYALGTPPVALNFPRRNRIIAGLARATLVVEAALKSGSLITARLASEQGRDVMAIPGSIHAPQYRGCHALIKQGAKLVETAQDVLEEFDSGRVNRPDPTPSKPNASDTGHAVEGDALIEALGCDPVGLDALQARTGLPTDHLLAELMQLELRGEVTRLPGSLFQRMGFA